MQHLCGEHASAFPPFLTKAGELGETQMWEQHKPNICPQGEAPEQTGLRRHLPAEAQTLSFSFLRALKNTFCTRICVSVRACVGGGGGRSCPGVFGIILLSL